MNNYYYILSSMPELSLDKRPAEEDLEEAISLILRQINEVDQESLAWFFRRNDLYNLIEFWQFEYDHLLERPLRKPFQLDKEALINIKLEPELLPNYLRDWYAEHKETMMHWSPNRIETELHQVFFEAIEELPAGFIRDYFLFERDLRALMATYHQARYSFLDQETNWLNKDMRNSLQKKPAQISNQMHLEKPYLEELLKALDTKDPSSIALAVHQVLWDKADALSKAHYFDTTALLNYSAKLFLLYRREQLHDNQNEARLQSLLDEALSNIQNHD
jgi:hypothetical protein